MAEQRHQADADSDANGGQYACHSYRRPDVPPPRRQTAFGQDHNESGESQRLGKISIFELDAQARLAEQHAEAKEEQQ
jgi:hypothetical protein